MDLQAALQSHTPDEAAAFVGWLVLQAGDADIDPGLEPHLVRFVGLVGLTPDLGPEQRQAKVERWFAQHPLPLALLTAFHASAAAIEAGTADATTGSARAATTLLGTAPSSIPVGHGGPAPGTLRGGLAGLIQSRGEQAKKP
jgi:hypothetical protein